MERVGVAFHAVPDNGVLDASLNGRDCNMNDLQCIRYVADNHKQTNPSMCYPHLPRSIWAHRSAELQIEIFISKTDGTAEVLCPQPVKY
jgi:hypothetical protein